MARSIREFNTELYREHLEEAAFLFTQRMALLDESDIPWQGLASFESRLEAHIDALVVGGDLAMQICAEQITVGDVGQLHAALSVFCRHRRGDLLASALTGIDLDDSAQTMALTEALKFEMPLDWVVFAERAVARGSTRLTDALATVSGYRRMEELSSVLLAALQTQRTPPLATALGQLRSTRAIPALEACVAQGDEKLRRAALLALLRTGSVDALQAQYLNARLENWPRLLLALSGSPAASTVLREVVEAGKASPDCLLGLGLLGDLSAIKTLYRCLFDERLAPQAALALQWATGANLYESVFDADEVKEDELFDSEKQVWLETQQPPMRRDGRLYGKQVRRLAIAPEAWSAWLSAHRGDFVDGPRYRSGVLCSPQTLVAVLRGSDSDRQLRRFSALELQTRYACPIAFETDMPVQQQLSALEEMGQWVADNAGQFQPGHWYIAGQRP